MSRASGLGVARMTFRSMSRNAAFVVGKNVVIQDLTPVILTNESPETPGDCQVDLWCDLYDRSANSIFGGGGIGVNVFAAWHVKISDINTISCNHECCGKL